MDPTITIILSVLALLVVALAFKQNGKEGFTADGWVLTQPPEWFHKQAYDVDDWFVDYSPDQLALPGGCDMHYRGDPRELNYLSSAYRFWRF